MFSLQRKNFRCTNRY